MEHKWQFYLWPIQYIYIYFFGGSGVWTQGFMFAKQAFYLSHTSSPFCSGYLFIYFLWYWDLNSGPTPWVTPPALFCDGLFQDRVLRTICQGWLRTAFLLISASWVARITGMSYWRQATLVILKMWSFKLFALGWSWTLILLISVFQAASIAGVSHQHSAQYILLAKGWKLTILREHVVGLLYNWRVNWWYGKKWSQLLRYPVTWQQVEELPLQEVLHAFYLFGKTCLKMTNINVHPCFSLGIQPFRTQINIINEYIKGLAV
jgi:hypothetical protein